MADGMRPETKYARSGDVYIAYHVVGSGPVTLVHTPGAVSHLESAWEQPSYARYITRLGRSFRVVLFDKRGTGMSDRADDIRAVMDAVGVERAALMGASEGGPMSVVFAATHPERTHALILYASMVTGTRTEDVPWAPARDVYDARIARLGEEWGSTAWLERRLKWLAPSRVHDAAFRATEFVTGERPVMDSDRVLATVLFTDIVDSTRRAVQLGDRGWRDALDLHHAMIRRELERHRGREVDAAGDGFLAVFDGPARAIRCASAAIDGARAAGLEIRAGLHIGEVEVAGRAVRGVAVHIGARIAALASPGEVLVSSTVKDLVAGSGITFDDRGTHALKGVPGEWRVYAARV